MVFASERDGGWGIYATRVEGGAQTLLAKQPYAWAPSWGAGR